MRIEFESGSIIELVGFIAPATPPAFVIPAFYFLDNDFRVDSKMRRSFRIIQDDFEGERRKFVMCKVDRFTRIVGLDGQVIAFDDGRPVSFRADTFQTTHFELERIYAYEFTNGSVVLGYRQELEVFLEFVLLTSNELSCFRRLELAKFCNNKSEIDKAIIASSQVVSQYNSKVGEFYREMVTMEFPREDEGKMQHE